MTSNSSWCVRQYNTTPIRARGCLILVDRLCEGGSETGSFCITASLGWCSSGACITCPPYHLPPVWVEVGFPVLVEDIKLYLPTCLFLWWGEVQPLYMPLGVASGSLSCSLVLSLETHGFSQLKCTTNLFFALAQFTNVVSGWS